MKLKFIIFILCLFFNTHPTAQEINESQECTSVITEKQLSIFITLLKNYLQSHQAGTPEENSSDMTLLSGYDDLCELLNMFITRSGSGNILFSSSGYVGIGQSPATTQLGVTGDSSGPAITATAGSGQLALSVVGNQSNTGTLNLPTTSSSVGYITINNTPFLSEGVNDSTSLLIGSNAGNLTFTSASDTTAVGALALQNIANGGIDNTAVGYKALHLNTTGTLNTAVGSLALQSNQTGTFNTALGFQALNLNTASDNTALGYVALSGECQYSSWL